MSLTPLMKSYLKGGQSEACHLGAFPGGHASLCPPYPCKLPSYLSSNSALNLLAADRVGVHKGTRKCRHRAKSSFAPLSSQFRHSAIAPGAKYLPPHGAIVYKHAFAVLHVQ